MGYYSRFTGELVTDQEITKEDIDFVDEVTDGFFEVKDGVIIPWEEDMKFYDQDIMIDKICAYFKNKGVTLNGSIERVGEESPDIEMIVVKNNVRTSHQLPQPFFNFEKMKWEFE